MIPPEVHARIRRLFFAEHWRIGTIATELGVHPDTVRRAIESERFNATAPKLRSTLLDPYRAFIADVLERHPRLRSTRLFEMIRERGYQGSAVQLRRYVRTVRPAAQKEAYLRLQTLPGEQAQVDWGNFGKIRIGNASRDLSCFVLVLSWSRAMYARFALDQTLESFLRGHIEAFNALGGISRSILYDNLQMRRARKNRRSHPLPPTSARSGRPLPLRPEALRPLPRKRKRARRKDHPIPTLLVLRRPKLLFPRRSQRPAHILDRNDGPCSQSPWRSRRPPRL